METDKSLTAIIDCFSAKEVNNTFFDRGSPIEPDTCKSPVREGVSGQPTPTGKVVGTPSRPYYLDYTLNLVDLDILPRRNIIPCKPKYIVQGCGCRRIIVPHTCHRYDCEPCAPWTSKQRAERVYSRLIYKRVCYTVLTVPLELREKCLKPENWQKVRKLAWEILRTHFGARFGVEASHPIGDKTGMFAPHLNYLWVQESGASPYIDVTLLRTLWAQCLGALRADVYHQYTTDEILKRHWSKYVTRVFPGFSYWTGSIRWYGRKPKAKKRPVCLCPDCGQPFRAIGEISADVVHEYYSRGFLLGLDPPWYNNSNITRYKKKRTIDGKRSEDLQGCNV